VFLGGVNLTKEKKEKPFYKKWWFILIAVLIFGFIVGITSEDVEKDTQKEAQSKEKKEQKDSSDNKKTEKKQKVSKPKKKTFKKSFDDELVFAEYAVDEIKVEIKDNTLILEFDWMNQSGIDDKHFTSLGYFDVMQGDASLDEISDAYDPLGNNNILRKIKSGVTLNTITEYKIKNDKPIEIKFGATNEYDNTKESITIKEWK